MILFILLLVFSWVLAAMLSLKFDAKDCLCPTDYSLIVLALLFWWLFAIKMLREKHKCYDNTYRY